MIRINLLREPSRKKPSAAALGQSKWLLLFLGLLALEFLLLGGWYYSMGGTLEDQQTEIQELQAEQQRLAVLQAQLEKFQREKQELEQRLTVVRRLQQSQEGPVKLMNSLVQSIPDAPNLWLTNLTQRGTVLTVEGRAYAIDPIADFMTRLTGRSPIKTVELDFWEREEGWVNFKITCGLE